MTRVFTILLSVVLVAAVAVPPAAAQSEETDIGVISADFGDELSPVDVIYATVTGTLAGTVDGVRDTVNELRGAGPTAADEADELAAEITDNREAYRTHLNDLVDEYDADVANETEVLRIDIDADDGSESVWIRVEADGESITALNASRTATWDATRGHELSATDAEDLNADLDDYRTEYVEEGETPEPRYFLQQGSKYVNISEVTT